MDLLLVKMYQRPQAFVDVDELPAVTGIPGQEDAWTPLATTTPWNCFLLTDEGEELLLPLAPPSVVGASSVTGATSATFTVNKPPNVVAGTMLVAFQALIPSAVQTPPSGWTLLTNLQFPVEVAQGALACYYYLAGGGEPSTYTFNNPTSSYTSDVWLYAINNAALPPTLGSTANVTAPSVSVAQAQSLLLCAFANSTNTLITPPSNLTDLGTLQASISLDSAWRVQTTTGTTGNETSSSSGGVKGSMQVLLAPGNFAVQPIEDEQEWPQDLVRQTPAMLTPFVAFAALDEDPYSRASVTEEDSFTISVQTIPWLAVAFTDEHATPTQYLLFDQEDFWTAQAMTAAPQLIAAAMDDEALARASVTEEDSTWLQSVTAAPWTAFVSTDEDPASPQINRYEEQEEFWTALVETTPWTAFIATDDEILPNAVNRYEEQEDLPPSLATAIAWLAFVATDDEILPNAKNRHEEQEEFWTAQVMAVSWTAFVARDEDATHFLGMDQQEFWTALVESTPWTAQTFLDDEILPGAVNRYLDQEEFWTALVETVPWKVLTFLDEHALNFLGIDQDEHWVAIVETVAWTARPFVDDEIDAGLKSFALENEDLSPTPTMNVAWVSRPFVDDEIDAGLLHFFREQEEPWLLQLTTVPWTVRVFSDDEILAGATNLALEQEEPWTGERTRVSWTAMPFLYDESTSQARDFFLEQQEFWTAQVTVIPWTARTFQDDEISAFLFLEQEEFWTAQTMTVTWKAFVVSDEQPYARLGYDQEEFWTVLVEMAPWTARPFRDDEILPGAEVFAREQEEPWIAATMAVAWTPRPFLDDEILGGARGFALEQEEPWTPLVTITVWLALPFLDDDLYALTRSTFRTIFLTDDYNPVQSVTGTPAPSKPST